ncbi:sensor histidine kinase [Paenibacillus sp. GCM10023250]|uniref:sensor histidine kinase n=1 Tax=Paenibacillus sp. GCM10023250 TaxID=3252648 RepID=UPI003614D8DF
MKRRRFRPDSSIRDKMLVAFTLVIVAGLLSLLLVSIRISEQNVSRIIGQDGVQLAKTMNIYLKQYFMTKNIAMDADAFRAEADGLVKELSAAAGSPVSVFDAGGGSLSALNADSAPASADFAQALRGNVAYSVRRDGAGAFISLSNPIEAGGTRIGIVNTVKRYADLDTFTSRFLTALRWFAVGIFVLVFLTAAWLADRITRPVDRLARSLGRVSEGLYEPVAAPDGNDELARLARAFNGMVEKIREQFATIERERDALKITQDMSKTFFDNVTHELKTPLATIRGYAQLMEENGFTDRPFFDKGIRYIIEESQRLNDKVVQILAFSTSGSERIAYRSEPVDLTALVRSLCEDMQVKAGKYGIVIRCDAEECLTLRGDREKLREMLLNVIDNAVKYGGVDSAVDVRAARSGPEAVRIAVRDRGPGIPPEHAARLFEPFYRVPGDKPEEERGSAGLGLAIVKTVAERHGGRADIRSTPGKGTTLTIELGGAAHA